MKNYPVYHDKPFQFSASSAASESVMDLPWNFITGVGTLMEHQEKKD